MKAPDHSPTIMPAPASEPAVDRIRISNGRPADLDGRGETEIAVYALLDRLGITYATACHEAAFTMEQCMAIETALGAPVCKNLFLCTHNKSGVYLLMLPSDKPFKTKYLSSQIGCSRLSFASAEDMETLLRIHPGAVSPMGLMNDADRKVRLIIDRDLLGLAEFCCHPCVNTATVRLAMKDFLELYLPAAGHGYESVELPAL